MTDPLPDSLPDPKTAEDVAALDALFGRGVALTVAGEPLMIRPFTFGQLPRVLAIIGPFLASLMQTRGDALELDLAALLARDSERALELCGLAAGRPRAWWDAVPSDDGLRLLAAVVEVNADFFVERMGPVAGPVWRRMKSRLPVRTEATDQDPTPVPVRTAGPASPGN